MRFKYLLLIIPIVIFAGLRLAFDFNGLYGQDSHEYLRYTKSLLGFVKSGSHPGDYFWPLLYPIVGAAFSVVFTPVLSLQMISVVSLMGSIHFAGQSLNLLYPDRKLVNHFLLVAFVLSPQIVLTSSLVMADMLGLFMVSAAFYFFIRLNSRLQSVTVLLFALFSACAFMTRYAAAVVLILPVFLTVKNLVVNKKYGLILGASMVAGICLLPHFIIRGESSTEFIGHAWLRNWSPVNFFKSQFATPDGYKSYPLPNIVYGFYNLVHPIYLFFGLALLPFIRTSDFSNKLVRLSLLIVLLSVLFLGGIPFQNKRFLMTSAPFLMVVIFPAFERTAQLISNRKLLVTVVVLLGVMQLYLSAFYLKKIINRNHLEQNIARTIKSYPLKTVYAFDVDISFPSYNVKNRVISLWEKPIDHFERGSLVVFNESELKEQWRDLNPMKNWNLLKNNYQLAQIDSFSNGWTLNEIH